MNIGQSPDAPILSDIRISVDIYSIQNNSPKPQRFSSVPDDCFPFNENTTILGDWLPDQKKSQQMERNLNQ
jgi:hypothetical protein